MTSLAHLGDVANVLQGRVPAKTTEQGISTRFFGIAEISGHLSRVVEPGIDLSHATYLQTGDVVIALLGDLGKSAIVGNRGDGAVLGRECAALRIPDTDKLLPAWLYAWTQSPHFKAQVAERASGSTMPRLNVRVLANFVLWPPLNKTSMLAVPDQGADQERCHDEGCRRCGFRLISAIPIPALSYQRELSEEVSRYVNIR